MARVKLGDVAREYKATCGDQKEGLRVVGLEHLIPQQFILTLWDEGKENTFTKMFKKGQVLFGRRRAYLKKAAVAPFDGICSGDITVIEAIPGKILPELLPFIIQNDTLFDFAVERSAGSLSPRVKWEHLKNFEFELPELDRQKELADILWASERAKTAYRELISSTDELVKSQFIEMFGDYLTEDRMSKLESCCDCFCDGDWIESKDQSDSGIRLIQTGNVGIGDFLNKGERSRFISENTFARLNCTEVLEGDILISRLPDPIGRACIVPGNLGKSITAVDCTIIRLKDTMLPNFLIAYTKTSVYMAQIDSFTTGSTRKRISRGNLGSIAVPVPEIELQRRFCELVEQFDKSKFAAKQALENLERTQKSLMNRYLG